MGENLDRRRGRTPRCNWVQGSNGLEAFKLAKASTANDGDKDGFYRSKELISIGLGIRNHSAGPDLTRRIFILSNVVGRSPILAN